MPEQPTKSLWEILWDYDPNGLIVVDKELRIRLINPAFSRMFKVEADHVFGQHAETILHDAAEFKEVWESNRVIYAKEGEYPDYDLHVRKVVFPIRDQELVACIMVDLTHEWRQNQEMMSIKRETIAKINEVVDNQMKVAQEIAGLLGETTAETKVNLLRLRQMVEQGIV
ncbi:MAG: PAS domain-containing protein [Anaerolineae bacterium]|nr:PAS domain-containing protein [Anaerolineae bacterium]